MMDVQVGRLLDALNSTGMLANCVIGFSSDNG
jgi:arylsulfatase A-like enzyme